VVERDVADAGIEGLSADRRFSTAYNAALQVASIALHAAGYRAVGAGHHWTTIQSLPAVMGREAQERADYLDSCRTKRNITNYDRAGEVSEDEAEEILDEVRRFREDLITWLKAEHPELLPENL